MNANITVLKDESLGGIEREYREVKRKANVGERIKIVAGVGYSAYTNGDTFVVERKDSDGCIFITDNAGDEEGVFDEEYVVLEPTDIIRTNTPDGDGKSARYRMVDRKAAVGERVIVTKVVDNYGFFSLGNIGVFGAGGWVDFNGQGNVGFDANDGFWRFGESNGRSEYRVLEPVESAEATEPLSAKPAPDQAAEIIAKLTTRVASLERRVTALEISNTKPIPRRTVKPAQHPSFTNCAIKSPQEIRDDIVKRAKEDVAKLLADACGDNEGAWESLPALKYLGHVTFKFAVNRQKRKVTALAFLKYSPNGLRPRFKASAKCAPGDVFNVWIGRAIALRRALGLAVPAEYFEAPNPTEVRVGDVVITSLVGGPFTVTFEDSARTVTQQLRRRDARIFDDSRTSETESDSAEPRKEVA